MDAKSASPLGCCFWCFVLFFNYKIQKENPEESTLEYAPHFGTAVFPNSETPPPALPVPANSELTCREGEKCSHIPFALPLASEVLPLPSYGFF